MPGPASGSEASLHIGSMILSGAARPAGGPEHRFGGLSRWRERRLDAARQALAEVLQTGSTEGPSGEPLAYPLEGVSLRAPIAPSTKVICMGRTFESHVVIGGLEPHPKPTPFYKLTQVVVGPDDYVVLPKHHYPEPVVYGTELTVVIGKGGRSIPEDRAAEHIWGYTVLNDVTMRGAYQTVAKSFDTSAPVGPWIVPQDQVSDPHNLQLLFRLNGEQVQAGSTRDLRFTVPAMVAESSKWLTLQPGDIIATGDVGATVPLRPGDLMEAEVESIGRVTQSGPVGGIAGMIQRRTRRARSC